MSDPVQRPRYFEGQVLAAEDLTAGLDYTRAQAARHNRLVHRWGIVTGLTLTETRRSGSGASWVEVTVSPGMAIDGTGREIVVPDAQLLDERAFERRRVAVGDAEAWYPVMIAGADLGVVPPPSTRKCTPARANRTAEGWQIDFAAPGFETTLTQQKPPNIDDGAGGAPNTPRWWILLGFVKWDATLRRFTAVANESNGIARRYVGVRADEITSGSGSLLMRTRDAELARASAASIEEGTFGATLRLGSADSAGRLAQRVTIDSDGTIESVAGKLALRSGAAGIAGVPVAALAKTPNGGTFTFGLQQATGELAKLFFVDEQGNLTIAGRFTGQAPAASFRAETGVQTMRVETGVAWDGTVLPLPEGVTQQQVDRGEVRLHLQVTPRACGTQPRDGDPSKTWIGSTSELSVDRERRVRCRVRWLGFASTLQTVDDLAGACDFLVIAVAVPPQ
jgi:hypothetical protein